MNRFYTISLFTLIVATYLSPVMAMKGQDNNDENEQSNKHPQTAAEVLAERTRRLNAEYEQRQRVEQEEQARELAEHEAQEQQAQAERDAEVQVLEQQINFVNRLEQCVHRAIADVINANAMVSICNALNPITSLLASSSNTVDFSDLNQLPEELAQKIGTVIEAVTNLVTVINNNPCMKIQHLHCALTPHKLVHKTINSIMTSLGCPAISMEIINDVDNDAMLAVQLQDAENQGIQRNIDDIIHDLETVAITPAEEQPQIQSTTITLVPSDAAEHGNIQISQENAVLSETIKTLLKDLGFNNQLPLAKVNHAMLTFIIELLQGIHNAQNTIADKQLSHQQLFDLICALNYLGIHPLVFACVPLWLERLMHLDEFLYDEIVELVQLHKQLAPWIQAHCNFLSKRNRSIPPLHVMAIQTLICSKTCPEFVNWYRSNKTRCTGVVLETIRKAFYERYLEIETPESLNNSLMLICKSLTDAGCSSETFEQELGIFVARLHVRRLYVEESSSLTTFVNDKNETVLHLVAQNRNIIPSVIRVILHAAGMDAQQLVMMQNSNGHTALYIAASKGNIVAVQALLSAPCVNNAPLLVTKQTIHGFTALHASCLGGHPAIVQALLSVPNVNAPQLVMMQNSMGSTALHYAAAMGNTDAVQALLSAPGLNVRQLVMMQDNGGSTALGLAQNNEHEGIVALLQPYIHQNQNNQPSLM